VQFAPFRNKNGKPPYTIPVEYPKGNFIRCNDWALDLSGAPASD
jgi:hypothetical protein